MPVFVEGKEVVDRRPFVPMQCYNCKDKTDGFDLKDYHCATYVEVIATCRKCGAKIGMRLVS